MTPVALDRLRDGRDISAVLRGRRQRAGRLVVVHAKRREDASAEPRIAVVASRRTGNAVQRNRAKRLLREASRHLMWAPGSDIVLVARAACAHSTFAAVHGELDRLASDLGLVTDIELVIEHVAPANSNGAEVVS